MNCTEVRLDEKINKKCKGPKHFSNFMYKRGFLRGLVHLKFHASLKLLNVFFINTFFPIYFFSNMTPYKTKTKKKLKRSKKKYYMMTRTISFSFLYIYKRKSSTYICNNLDSIWPPISHKPWIYLQKVVSKLWKRNFCVIEKKFPNFFCHCRLSPWCLMTCEKVSNFQLHLISDAISTSQILLPMFLGFDFLLYDIVLHNVRTDEFIKEIFFRFIFHES